jgi:hypothetical protein
MVLVMPEVETAVVGFAALRAAALSFMAERAAFHVGSGSVNFGFSISPGARGRKGLPCPMTARASCAIGMVKVGSALCVNVNCGFFVKVRFATQSPPYPSPSVYPRLLKYVIN